MIRLIYKPPLQGPRAEGDLKRVPLFGTILKAAPRRRTPRRGAVVPLLALLGFSTPSIPCHAAGPRDYSYRFNLWNEATGFRVNNASPFNPNNLWLGLPAWSDSLIAEGEASMTFAGRFRIAGSFTNRYDSSAGSHDRLRVRELYLNWSLNSHWDVTAGKRILKWGTGYAWTPTGVLDPVRDPRDPTDRLSQYEGRELVELRGTYGAYNFDAVYSSPRLFSRLQTRSREDQWAFKFNSLYRKLDYSLVASFGGLKAANRYGANATYVLGKSLELHGEFVAQRGSRVPYPGAVALQDPRVTFASPVFVPLKEHDDAIYSRSLVGANYTLPSGWNFVAEYYNDQQGLGGIERRRFDAFVQFNAEQSRLLAESSPSAVTLPAANLLWTLQGLGGFNRTRNYFFVRVAHDRLANKWSLENISIFSLRDGSSIWIPQVSFDFSELIGTYLRYTYYAGSRTTEFGSLPWRSTWNLGLALRF